MRVAGTAFVLPIRTNKRYGGALSATGQTGDEITLWLLPSKGQDIESGGGADGGNISL
jgi:hypothetical protein